MYVVFVVQYGNASTKPQACMIQQALSCMHALSASHIKEIRYAQGKLDVVNNCGTYIVSCPLNKKITCQAQASSLNKFNINNINYYY